MADPISIASGLLTLVGFAFQSSNTLYQVISSFRSSRRDIRDLRQELEALNEILLSLNEIVKIGDANLAALKLPLLRCGKVCGDFEAVILKCTEHSGGERRSIRDWTKLRYMGEDIAGFKNMLAGYKSTIAIALGDANIRTATVTANVLNEYKEMIKNTTSDLEEHLQEIDRKLQLLSMQGAKISGENDTEQQRIQEERESTRQCLDICAQVSAHIDTVQLNSFGNMPALSHRSPTRPETSGSARLVTQGTLQACKTGLTNTTSHLEKQLQDINDRLQKLYQQVPLNEHATEQASVKEEMDSIKQCLDICAQAANQAVQARTNVFEDVLMADDGHQIIVATLGDLISAKRVTAGARSMQWLGQMSDASLQHLSQNSSQKNILNEADPKTVVQTQFEGRYGEGYKLNLEDLKDGEAAPSQEQLP